MATARQLDQSTTSLYEQDFFIQGQRRELARLIKQSPSLKAFIPEVLNELWQDAREDAEIETGMPIQTFPKSCSWDTNEQILNKTWWPE